MSRATSVTSDVDNLAERPLVDCAIARRFGLAVVGGAHLASIVERHAEAIGRVQSKLAGLAAGPPARPAATGRTG